MSELANSWWWMAAALVAIVAGVMVVRVFFNREARERRRRQRSHGRVVSRAVRPMVSLAVDTEPDRRKNKS